MFETRYRSHHDAEQRLYAALAEASGGKHAASRRAPSETARRVMTGVSGLLGKLNAVSGSQGFGWEQVETMLQGLPSDARRCVYIHVPYCDRICSFCNLNRSGKTGNDLGAYTAQLEKELREYGAYPYVRGKPFEAVYFGGGTPTILSAEQLERILAVLKEHIPLSPDCEITLESTLHNLDMDKAKRLERAGVNRFSVGIQTFSDRGRQLLGRVSPAAEDRLRRLREVFSGVLGIDIIYHYPDETPEELLHDAETCAENGIDSVSFYSLMIQDGSALGKTLADKAAAIRSDIETDRALHNLFYDTMRSRSYELLEISKLARPGRDEYRYIRIRYDNGDVLPVGSGAGGSIGAYPVYEMAPNCRMVSKRNPVYEIYNRLLGHFQFGEYDLARLSDLPPELRASMESRIRYFEGSGLLTTAGDAKWTLTSDGVFWGNNIAVDVLKAGIARGGALA
jgi:oxygen-independent coproporphyrinogen-3 oxidase